MKPAYMMTRKERQAAAAQKLTAKANPVSDSTPTPKPPVSEPVAAPPSPKPQISDAKLAANQANSLLSTGPKSEAGKRASSHNAVKNALTGQTVLLPTDDTAAYQNLGRQFVERHKPVGFEEECLVQSLIDSEWRLMRIPSQEASILAVGRHLLADTVPAQLLEAEVYLKYERSLKNLQINENRLRRYRENDLKALKALQTARFEKEALQKKAQQMKQKEQPSPASPKPQEATVGFVFETTEPPLETAA